MKNNFKEKSKHFFSAIGQLLLVLLVIWGETVGVYHSATKHGQLGLALFVPPVAWYRGIEIFWHNDLAGINWEKRIQADRMLVIGLLNEYPSAKDKAELKLVYSTVRNLS